MTRDEAILAGLLASIDGWVAHLEEIRRQGCKQKDLDHFQATLCQASHSLRQLLARGGKIP